jgi:Putative restriction endonuclease
MTQIATGLLTAEQYYVLPDRGIPTELIRGKVIEMNMPDMLTKAGEYLDAGVSVVCVVDQISETVHVYRLEDLPVRLEGDDELALPDILGDFRVAVRRFFS